jgi:hypothetical protein
VRDWLGHANITDDEPLSGDDAVTLDRALRQFEEHRTIATSLPHEEKTDAVASRRGDCRKTTGLTEF